MRTRLTSLLAILLLSFGVVACDDTTEGLEEDTQELEEAGEGVAVAAEVETDD